MREVLTKKYLEWLHLRILDPEVVLQESRMRSPRLFSFASSFELPAIPFEFHLSSPGMKSDCPGYRPTAHDAHPNPSPKDLNISRCSAGKADETELPSSHPFPRDHLLIAVKLLTELRSPSCMYRLRPSITHVGKSLGARRRCSGYRSTAFVGFVVISLWTVKLY